MSGSRVRENRMHGLTGGRWRSGSHGEPDTRTQRETGGTEPGHLPHADQPAAYLTARRGGLGPRRSRWLRSRRFWLCVAAALLAGGCQSVRARRPGRTSDGRVDAVALPTASGTPVESWSPSPPQPTRADRWWRNPRVTRVYQIAYIAVVVSGWLTFFVFSSTRPPEGPALADWLVPLAGGALVGAFGLSLLKGHRCRSPA